MPCSTSSRDRYLAKTQANDLGLSFFYFVSALQTPATMDRTLDQTTIETISLLEARLLRIEQILFGSAAAPIAPAALEDSVVERITLLERDFSRLVSKIKAYSELLDLCRFSLFPHGQSRMHRWANHQTVTAGHCQTTLSPRSLATANSTHRSSLKRPWWPQSSRQRRCTRHLPRRSPRRSGTTPYRRRRTARRWFSWAAASERCARHRWRRRPRRRRCGPAARLPSGGGTRPGC